MKKSFVFLLLVGTVFLTGCSKTVELTGHESDALSDYMANVVLKHAENYESNLYTLDEIAKIETDALVREQKFTDAKNASKVDVTTEDKSSTTKDMDATNTDVKKDESTNVVSDKVSTTSTNKASLTKTIGNSNFNIEYKGFDVVKSYKSGDGIVSIDADTGKELVIVKFAVKNKSKSKVTLDLVEEGIKYQLNVNKAIEKPLLTLIVNDIQYFNMEIEGGKTKEAIILFEVDNEVDMSNATLTVTRNNVTSNIDVK